MSSLIDVGVLAYDEVGILYRLDTPTVGFFVGAQTIVAMDAIPPGRPSNTSIARKMLKAGTAVTIAGGVRDDRRRRLVARSRR